ncbi:hypothetical protein M2132_002322 [Dysgonomonas sp. PH5-45]|uniref:hypothetical protein n=1 Tax=unclassified Dysgonomonas TaxID=2630389 RepID=UPI0024737008|nr:MULTISPECIES: hypothetical protein [unclassified Dysgonomonas]MDH6355971.1 hypothetical protein [Dysgonomonas sp. PH5-45]MDH6388866.1 hypothetical protein [Dysgonomonas sp. PH5-37]
MNEFKFNVMRKYRRIISISICLFIGIALQAQEAVDYITSGYYQFIYEADIAHLEGNDSLAYQKLQQAEQVAPLKEQDTYYEMSLYIDLSLEKGHYEKAVHYMNILVSEYGRDPSTFWDEDASYFASLQKHINTDSLLTTLNQKLEVYYSLERKKIVDEIVQMINNDQRVRIEGRSLNNKDATDAERGKAYQEWLDVDAYNAKRMLEIVDEYGFPGLSLYGYKNIVECYGGLTALFLHISDKQDIKDVILTQIRQGKCPPELYGLIVDRHIEKNACVDDSALIYAAFRNRAEALVDSEIIDRINTNRKAIGMPTIETAKQRTWLKNEKMKGIPILTKDGSL